MVDVLMGEVEPESNPMNRRCHVQPQGRQPPAEKMIDMMWFEPATTRGCRRRIMCRLTATKAIDLLEGARHPNDREVAAMPLSREHSRSTPIRRADLRRPRDAPTRRQGPAAPYRRHDRAGSSSGGSRPTQPLGGSRSICSSRLGRRRSSPGIISTICWKGPDAALSDPRREVDAATHARNPRLSCRQGPS